MIVVDSREAEKQRKIVEMLEKSGSKVQVSTLDVADYFIVGIKEILVIERKDVFDFISSMNSGRLWNQLERMKEIEIVGENIEKTEKVLLVEGSPSIFSNSFRRKIRIADGSDEKSLLGRMDAIIFKWGIPIVWTGNKYLTAQYLSWKDKDMGEVKEKKEYKVGVTVGRDLPVEKQAIAVLESLTGVKTAEAILTKFKTLRNVFNARPEDFEGIKVGGKAISKTVVERIVAVANAEINILAGEVRRNEKPEQNI